MQDLCLHAKLHCKTESLTGLAVQFVTRALSQSTWGVFRLFSPHLIYDGKTALLHVKKSCSAGFSPRYQRESVGAGEGPMTTQKEADRTAWELSGATDHAMRLFTQQFYSHLNALLGSNSLCTLDDDKLLEYKAVKIL